MEVPALSLKWQSLTPSRADDLTAQCIHLWTAHLPSLTTDRALSLLTDSELTRAARYQNLAQREMYLGGRIGLRKLLSAYTGIENAALTFNYGARGKPEIENATVTFNYSLSGGYALYAIARDRQLGVDLETLPRTVNANALAAKKLTSTERRAWLECSPSSRDTAMLACWTRKESYGKAIGVGIRYVLNQVPVCAELNSARWQCPVTGLFDAPSASPSRKILHGVQLALPFPAVAALMYDGDSDGDRVKLHGMQLHPDQ